MKVSMCVRNSMKVSMCVRNCMKVSMCVRNCMKVSMCVRNCMKVSIACVCNYCYHENDQYLSFIHVQSLCHGAMACCSFCVVVLHHMLHCIASHFVLWICIACCIALHVALWYCIACCIVVLHVILHCMLQEQTEVIIFFQNELPVNSQLKIVIDDVKLPVHRRNPYTGCFFAPGE